ncbi:MAG: restriction endonuclease subunit S [Microcoleus vaginatus WJT46-NPBG5]|nr:restriction endonuclease subunit S [Microcoleus vaginatus WJT46-NPBG5]
MIPEDWDVVPITKATSEIFLGLTAKVDYVNSGGIPLIRASDIANSKLSFAEARTISVRQHKKLTKYRRPKRGDVLVSKSGSLGICAIVDVDIEFSIYESIIVLQSNQFLNSNFLLWLLRDKKTQFRIIGEKVGSTVGHLNLEMFRKLIIPLPLIEEQKVIAQTLSDVDALIAALDKLIAKKRGIKTGTMQQLLAGKKRLPGFAMEWNKCRLGDIVDKIVGGGTPSRSNPDFWGGKIPWTTVKDFATFNPFSTQEYITEEGLSKSASNLIPKGTLITSTRMALGKAIIYEIDVAINQDLKAIFPKLDVNNIYLYYWFQNNSEYLEILGSGSTVKGISLIDLKSIPFLKPSLEEQQAIAQVLSDMDTEITALETRRAKTQAIKQGMMQELLTGKTRLI